MGWDQIRFSLVWRWHQLLSGSLPNGRISRVSQWLRLGWELFIIYIIFFLFIYIYLFVYLWVDLLESILAALKCLPTSVSVTLISYFKSRDNNWGSLIFRTCLHVSLWRKAIHPSADNPYKWHPLPRPSLSASLPICDSRSHPGASIPSSSRSQCNTGIRTNIIWKIAPQYFTLPSLHLQPCQTFLLIRAYIHSYIHTYIHTYRTYRVIHETSLRERIGCDYIEKKCY